MKISFIFILFYFMVLDDVQLYFSEFLSS